MEEILPEGAVMLALAEWLFSLSAGSVSVHPDGMHLKAFGMAEMITAMGFTRTESSGRTDVGGLWTRGDDVLRVHPSPGFGDVVATLGSQRIEIEAKGGVLNTRHPGQVSRLRRGLHEAVGQLMACERQVERLVAAVPDHPETRRAASRLAPRCTSAGIEIALVDAAGRVTLVPPRSPASIAGRTS